MMKLERLEDIRKYVEDAGETWYYRGMLSELIGHIDELHKAVSVDTSGAVDFGAGIIDPNRIAQILVNGKWVDAEVVREAAKRLGMVERGGAVVVPEMPCDDWNRIMHSTDWVPSAMRQVSDWYIANINSIPADRVVLADGMVGVDREELMYLHAFEKYARKHGPESIQDVAGTLDHLRRAQQVMGSV